MAPPPTAAPSDWIAAQQAPMCERITAWSGINSGSRNLPGLAAMLARVRTDFDALDGDVLQHALPPETIINNAGETVPQPLGQVLSIRKRPEAAIRVLLVIHMDTVYGLDHPFQVPTRLDERTLRGPGVADAKGGLCIMLTALQAFEQSDVSQRLGWEVLINPDEELGSPGSADLLREAAQRNHLGLVFEPALADGSLLGERKGSGNFTAVIRGRAAHAGRDFHHGRNAIHAAAELVNMLEDLNRTLPGATVNVGRIDGGGPSNIVPDLAIVRFNVRVPAHEHAKRIEAEILRAVQHVGRRDGVKMELSGGFTSPPRPMDVPTTRLYGQLAECGRELGLNLNWHASGGVSDANRLAAAGLPTIDTLGPCGGNLHNADEFVLLDSLVPRTQLTTLLLMKIARGDVQLEAR